MGKLVDVCASLLTTPCTDAGACSTKVCICYVRHELVSASHAKGQHFYKTYVFKQLAAGPESCAESNTAPSMPSMPSMRTPGDNDEAVV